MEIGTAAALTNPEWRRPGSNSVVDLQAEGQVRKAFSGHSEDRAWTGDGALFASRVSLLSRHIC